MSKEQEMKGMRYTGKTKSNGTSMKADNDVSEKEANGKKSFKSKGKALKKCCK